MQMACRKPIFLVARLTPHNGRKHTHTKQGLIKAIGLPKTYQQRRGVMYTLPQAEHQRKKNKGYKITWPS